MADKCEHRRARRMTWPDNGDSELCTDCLLTRHHWEQGDSGWQDHGYKSPADWYREAAEFEDSMTENTKQDKNTDGAPGVGVQRVVSVRAKTGRCANGSERDAGTVFHAVESGRFPCWDKALCGTAPGKKGNGWQLQTLLHSVTCKRCLSVLNAH